jgi:hypothetical protein
MSDQAALKDPKQEPLVEPEKHFAWKGRNSAEIHHSTCSSDCRLPPLAGLCEDGKEKSID